MKFRFTLQVPLNYFCFFLFHLSSVYAVSEKQEVSSLSRPLTINIVGYDNKAGLTKDIEILTEALSNLGHDVDYIDYREKPSRTKVDINIFLFLYPEVNTLFSFASQNYFIPNPEWCHSNEPLLLQFDKILCKTREAERIFKSFHPQTVLMGFSSKDCFDSAIPKNYHALFHVMGMQKGSDVLCQIWQKNPTLPLLKAVNYQKNIKPMIENMDFVDYWLTEEEIKMMRNSYGLHLCPSKTEGFGHSLNEALCCEAVLVTTNAPPMNEFVSDPRCLVNYYKTKQWRLGTAYFPDSQHLEEIILDLLKLPEEELQRIGQKNRELYLKNDQLFKQRLQDIFGRAKISTP